MRKSYKTFSCKSQRKQYILEYWRSCYEAVVWIQLVQDWDPIGGCYEHWRNHIHSKLRENFLSFDVLTSARNFLRHRVCSVLLQSTILCPLLLHHIITLWDLRDFRCYARSNRLDRLSGGTLFAEGNWHTKYHRDYVCLSIKAVCIVAC
jgi:hypothetical protein